MRGHNAKRWSGLWVCLLAALLAGCDVLAPPPPTPTPPTASGAKQLATVYIPPTPDEAARQATRFAATDTPAAVALAPATATPTVYVGLFLGDSSANVPNINPAEIDGGPPTRTPIPNRCPLAPDETLGERWRLEPTVVRGLGCAIEGLLPFEGTTQIFERGAMYGRDNGQMWAVRVGEPGTYWFVEEPPEVELTTVDAPPGLIVPGDAFGALWRGIPDVQQSLGFATTPEIPLPLGVQRFEGGTLFFEAETGQVFALLADGSAYGPY